MTNAILLSILMTSTPEAIINQVALERAKIELAAVERDIQRMKNHAAWTGFYTRGDVNDTLDLFPMRDFATKRVAELNRTARPLPAKEQKMAKKIAACLVADWAKPAGFVPESCDVDSNTRDVVAYMKAATTDATQP